MAREEKVSVLIAEDHTILREGLRALLCASEEFEVVGESPTAARP